MLTWTLRDIFGNRLGRFDERKSASVALTLHEGSQAALSVSVEEPLAKFVYPHATLLQVELDHTPIFKGACLTPIWHGSERRVEIAAVGPEFYVQRLFINNRPDGVFLNDFVAVDRGEGMARILEHLLPTAAETADGILSHGVIIDRDPAILQPSVVLDRGYEAGKDGWSAIVDLAEDSPNAPDLDLEPVAGTDGRLALLRTYYPRRGSDKSGTVALHFNTGRMNVSDFEFSPLGEEVLNRYTAVGQSIEGAPSNRYTANSVESQQGLRIVAGYEGMPDLVYMASLQAAAQARVATNAFPAESIKITPALDDGSRVVRTRDGQAFEAIGGALGIPPAFGPDPEKHAYWLGDTIHTAARDGHQEYAGDSRVVGARLNEQEGIGGIIPEIDFAPVVTAVGVT